MIFPRIIELYPQTKLHVQKNVYLIGHSPSGLFRTNANNDTYRTVLGKFKVVFARTRFFNIFKFLKSRNRKCSSFSLPGNLITRLNLKFLPKLRKNYKNIAFCGRPAANDDTANQIHGFTIDYDKFILMAVSINLP